jgi:hypothetical protein
MGLRSMLVGGVVALALPLALSCAPEAGAPARRDVARAPAQALVVQTTADFATNGNREYGLDWAGDKLTRRKPYTTVGPFTDLGRNYPGTTRQQGTFSLAELSGGLYLLGGWSSSNVAATPGVLGAPINSNGSLGAWATAGGAVSTSGYAPRFESVAYNGVTYLGSPVSTSFSVWSARLDPLAAAFGTFTDRGLITGMSRSPMLTVVGNRLYAADGSDGTKDMKFATARLDALGAVGTWQTLPGPAPTVLQMLYAFSSWNGHLYVIGAGGCNGIGCNPVAMMATLGPDGTTASWAPFSPPQLALAYDNFVFDGSFYASNNSGTTLKKAVINVDGSMGPGQAVAADFTLVASQPYVTAGPALYAAPVTPANSLQKMVSTEADAPPPRRPPSPTGAPPAPSPPCAATTPWPPRSATSTSPVAGAAPTFSAT